MAEVGTHQLDACSIFLGKKRPIAVCGIGGTFYYDDGREVDDHVFVNFEFPYEVDEQKNPVGQDRLVVSYSSITTNAFEDYGEMLMGTQGTMMVLKEFDKTLVDVAGHTDSTGSLQYNQALSERRAGSVAAFLQSQGVAEMRFMVRGYGPNMPVASNATAEGRAMNRRVEMQIIPITQ